jgi:hypothetical protein
MDHIPPMAVIEKENGSYNDNAPFIRKAQNFFSHHTGNFHLSYGISCNSDNYYQRYNHLQYRIVVTLAKKLRHGSYS